MTIKAQITPEETTPEETYILRHTHVSVLENAGLVHASIDVGKIQFAFLLSPAEADGIAEKLADAARQVLQAQGVH